MSNNRLRDQTTALFAENGFSAPPRILFVASEYAPLVKTGGLADVVGTLPKYLCRLGYDARVILPYHSVIREKYSTQTEHLFDFEINLGWRTKYVGIKKLELERVCLWLVENDEYFGGPVYQSGREGEQYAYFTKAVLESIPQLGFRPDVIHCHDWHTGMLPFLLRTQYFDKPIAAAKVLLTIHNIAYQGLCGLDFVTDYLSVPSGSFGLLERFGQADFLKAGCIMADRVNTVSPSYAKEICTPEYGEGLDGVLEFREDVTGIINGIDKAQWNPGKDRWLPVNYTASKLLGKLQCKTALLEELGLELVPHRPLIGMVTRLAEQKGLDLVMNAMDELLRQNDFSFVLLGSGDPGYEAWFRALEERWHGRVCAWIGFNDALSHRIYAGCDFFLMPSRFEPCGISQLISMAYGTLPIVRETGGLRDTVDPYNRFTGAGTGFSFARYDSGDMSGAIRYALDTYRDKNAMSVDYSCDAWAFEYGKLYLDMIT